MSCFILPCAKQLFFFLQLKSSLMLHIDGTSPVAEDIGRQVYFLHIKRVLIPMVLNYIFESAHNFF